MRRTVLVPLVLALMLVAMMAFAGLAFAQPPEGTGPPEDTACNGLGTANEAGADRQGPPAGKGPPMFTADLPAGEIAPALGNC